MKTNITTNMSNSNGKASGSASVAQYYLWNSRLFLYMCNRLCDGGKTDERNNTNSSNNKLVHDLSFKSRETTKVLCLR